MKKLIRKTLALLLALTMVFGAAPLTGLVGIEIPSLKDVFVKKAEAIPYGDLFYLISNSEVTITGCSSSARGTLEIPATIGGYPVTSIGNFAFQYSNISSANIPNSVTSIGECAFNDCSELTNITIPDSVTSIGDCAFRYCARLTSVTIGNGVTSIDGGAFEYCTGLTSITIPDSVTSIGDWAFGYCTRLTSITIPDSVTSIGDWAFRYCTKLTSITIPDSVTSIGYGAFYNCNSLTSVTIGNGVISIGSSAFVDCSSLTNITIPNSVTSLGNSVFSGCSNLSNITIPDSVTSLGNYVFSDCSSLTNITIPGSVASIGDSAFSGCTRLTSITIPDSVTSIGCDAFYNCDGLTSVTIPDSVTFIGDWAFSGCTGLTSITIPDSVTSLGDSVFRDCSSLTNITIPNSVTSLGDSVFRDCSSLTNIIIPDSVTSLGDFVFSGCSKLTSITISNNITSIGNSSFECCYELTNIAIPDAVTSIGELAFYYCTGLTSITIPDAVTSIGELAFYDCTGLTSVTIPDSVTSIGNYAFNHCTGLKSITVDGSNQYYSSDESGVLFNKDKTELIQYPIRSEKTEYIIPDGVRSIAPCAFNCFAYGLTSVTIPDSVTSIGNYAFYDCTGLKSVTIGSGVTSIGVDAFFGCAYLKDVYYEGSEDQWNSIDIGENNDCLLNATIHFNSSGNGESGNPDVPPDESTFYTLHGFSSEPLLHLGKAEIIDMQFEVEAYDGVNPSVLVANPTFSFTSSDTNVFQIDNITKNGKSTSIEIASENPGVAILTVTAYVDGKYVAGGQYRVTVEGESVYHAKTVPVRDDFNFISNEIIIDNFEYKDNGNGYCSVSFDAYNQANCIGSVDVYDKDGNLLYSKAISAFTGDLPTGLWNSVKKLFEIFNEDFYRDRSYKEKKYSKKTEISLYQIPIDGYISISNDVNSSVPCALYNISKLVVKISSEILGSFFKSAPSEEVVDQAAESLALEVLTEMMKSPVSSGTIFDILEEFCLAINHGSSSEEMDAVVDDYILYVDALNIDVGQILIDAAKNAGIGVVEGLVYKSLGPVGTIIKTSFKMFSLSKTAEHIDTLKEFADSGKTSVYFSSAYDSKLYSNGYYVFDRELFDENVTFHQYAITSGNDYLDSIGVFNDMEYVNVIGMDLYQNGKKIQPSGTVEVAIPVPEDIPFSEILNIRVYRKESDGSFTKLECDFRNYQNGYLYINTEHFSVYCIVAESKSRITDISFEKTDLSLLVDEYIINEPTILPNNITNAKFTWISSDETVAKVTKSGYVIGINPGKAVITAVSEDGEISASYNVNVNGNDNWIDFPLAIKNPSTTTIDYGDSIILHAQIDGALPEGSYIVWSGSNGNFDMSVSDDGMTCKISPRANGKTTFTITVYDKDGKVISSGTQVMTANAGLWQRIVAIFKNIFGLTKTIPQIFKGVF